MEDIFHGIYDIKQWSYNAAWRDLEKLYADGWTRSR